MAQALRLIFSLSSAWDAINYQKFKNVNLYIVDCYGKKIYRCPDYVALVILKEHSGSSLGTK